MRKEREVVLSTKSRAELSAHGLRCRFRIPLLHLVILTAVYISAASPLSAEI